MKSALLLKLPAFRQALAPVFFDYAPEELWELMDFAETIGESPESFAQGFAVSFWNAIGPGYAQLLGQQLAALRLAHDAGRKSR